MLKNTVPSHHDHQNLQYGYKNVKELADYINTNKNDADEIQKVIGIQEKLINWPAVRYNF